MKRLTADEVHARKVAELGLDPTALDLTSVEALAAAIRRAAGFLCPCTAATLLRNVLRPLRGLVDNIDDVKSAAEQVLEAIVAHGDILEYLQTDDDPARGAGVVLYAAPPSFVARASGTIILLGIASDQLSALPDELQSRIESESYVRRLTPMSGEDLRNDLLELGLIELSSEAWLKAPLAESPAEHVARLNQALDLAQPSRDVPGLTLLDADRPVRYYRGRWAEPKAHSGRFVARRKQAYGADLWCYVELRDGRPERLVDFPIATGRWRGCDEAWRLQMAIDAKQGHQQQVRIQQGPGKSSIIQLFSPVPMWARRRWGAIGEPVPSSGCLFAYRIGESELAEELQFARDMLWLIELPVAQGRQQRRV